MTMINVLRRSHIVYGEIKIRIIMMYDISHRHLCSKRKQKQKDTNLRNSCKVERQETKGEFGYTVPLTLSCIK